MKRDVGIAATIGAGVLALLLGLGATQFLESRQKEAVIDQGRQLASTTAQSAMDELQKRLDVVEGRATTAASLSPVRALMGAQVDFATFRDSFATEDWWRAFAEDFSIQQVLMGPELYDLSRPSKGAFDGRPLAEVAQKDDRSSRIVGVQGSLYLMSAVAVDLPSIPASRRPVVLLGKALDEKALDAVATRVRSAIVISDGQQVSAQAGSPEHLAQLASLVGREKSAPHSDVNGTASAFEVTPGIWVWTYTDTSKLAQQASNSLGVPRIAIWVAVLSLAGMAAVFAFRRRPAPAAFSDVDVDLASEPPSPLEHPREALATFAPPPVPAAVPVASPADVTAASPSNNPGAGGSERGAARYQLVARLGENETTEAFLAVSFGAEGFRRFFVLKRLKAEFGQAMEAVNQFVDEARLGSSLVHSNIVPVYDFGKMGDAYFMAREFIAGRDLGNLAKRLQERDHQRLDASLTFFIAQEVLKGLAYAHSRLGPNGEPLRVVHRDVSPNNVMLSARGEVKLFNFGVMKAPQGAVKGNLLFMSPEQARGAYQLDARSDLFSLGLTLYWCLTGETLYRGDNTYDLLMKASKGLDAPEWERVQRLPGPAAQVLQRALKTAPEERFQNADEFAAAIPQVGIAGAGVTLRNHMTRLFGEDFQKEERRMQSGPPWDVSEPLHVADEPAKNRAGRK
ncbi:MAG: serine/threonine-protein kinase [Myxococcaceae bacterium]